ncbi:MAG: 16S rRNA (uracil(1498)-N(3))-methyltransferase [Verrucomicrobia bacterium]|nr:16S rRNA (uracil(1498)-N(3))-methyltransferase [Verrucomicrobiota bacterium]MDA1085772.1 16S rRNA (uracil(1498)-N(3))-methyltransferase [Verrucomicrobiota bacterium]
MTTSRPYRFFLPSEHWVKIPLRISRREARHLVDVLRVQCGDRVELFDAAGKQAQARVQSVGREGVSLEIESERVIERRGPIISLVQAMPKSQKMELIIQKATELGTAAIYPVRSERCVVRLDAQQAVERAGRWQRIALEAATQCGNAWPPVVHAPVAYSDWCEQARACDLMLLGSMEAGAVPLRKVMTERGERPCDSVILLIGPEGDFTAGETKQALGLGAIAVDFGALTLRSETAAIYGLSVLAYELGTLN